MAGEGGWHRFGLSWAPWPGAWLQGRNRNLFSTGDDSALGKHEAKSGDVWSLQLVGDAEQRAGKAPAQNLPAPGVSRARWGDAGLRLPRKTTHLVGPMWGSPVLEPRGLFSGRSVLGREPTAPSCQSPCPPGARAAQCPRPAKPPPWSQGQEDSEGLESRSVTCICWMIPVTWELWLPGEDGGGCLVPKLQGLEDAGTQDWPCAWHREGVT